MKSLVLIIAAIVLLASCQPAGPTVSANGQSGQASQAGQNGGKRSAVVAVQAETLKYGPLEVNNTTAGTVVADVQSLVTSQTTGTVIRIVRKAGDWVEAGASVVQLDDSQLQLSLKLAQANLATAKLNAGARDDGTFAEDSKSKLQLQNAQRTYDAAVALKKIDGISGTDFDTALSNLEIAKIAVQQDRIAVSTAMVQVQQAQLNLQYTTIRAPFSGQIVSVNVHPGEFVASNTVTFVLVSRAKDVNFNVPPADVSGLTRKAKITFTQDGLTAPISLVGVPSAPVNGVVPLQAALPAGFPGAYGTVGTVAYSQVLATGVLVPIPAIQTLENTTYVYVIHMDNKVSQSPVSILADSGTYAAVTGLKAGDLVVVNPPPGLLPGATVRILQGVGAGSPANTSAANFPASQQGQQNGRSAWTGGQGGSSAKSSQYGPNQAKPPAQSGTTGGN